MLLSLHRLSVDCMRWRLLTDQPKLVRYDWQLSRLLMVSVHVMLQSTDTDVDELRPALQFPHLRVT